MLAGDVRVRDGYSREQSLQIGVMGVFQQLTQQPEFHDLAHVHDGDPAIMRKLAGGGQVVGDVDWDARPTPGASTTR